MAGIQSTSRYAGIQFLAHPWTFAAGVSEWHIRRREAMTISIVTHYISKIIECVKQILSSYNKTKLKMETINLKRVM